MRVRIAAAAHLQRGELRRFVVDGVPVCVAAAPDGNLYAVSDVCSHEEASLSEGELLGFEVECPLHVSRFDVRTGKAVAPPATRPIRTFRVTVEDGEMYLEVQPDSQNPGVVTRTGVTVLPAHPSMIADYFVAMTGRDDWSGLRPEPNAEGTDGPFASLGRARRAIELLRTSGRPGDLIVRIRGGRYYVPPDVVDGIAEDTSKRSDRTIYAAYGDEEPIFSSGVHIPGWRRRQDWYLTLYLPPIDEHAEQVKKGHEGQA